MTSEIVLANSFKVQPQDLLEVSKRVPVDEQYYVPLFIFGRPFTVVEPTLTLLNDSAVAWSLDAPFGFIQETNTGDLIRSQKTEKVILMPGNQSSDPWRTVVSTPHELNDIDADIMGRGINLFVMRMTNKLLQQRREAETRRQVALLLEEFEGEHRS